MFHFGRVQTRSYSVSNASKTRFKTRLDSKNFHMGSHIIYEGTIFDLEVIFPIEMTIFPTD